jgi:hypothetical protein
MQNLVLDTREAVVDGVLDGGRQANRRTTGHQADGKHQILGREQYRRTTDQQTEGKYLYREGDWMPMCRATSDRLTPATPSSCKWCR